MGRRGKIGISLLVILLLLGGGLIVADRIAVEAAENRIADQAKKELVNRNIEMPGNPSVNIVGFPFLTQVFAGEYHRIDIGVPKPTANGVQFDDITVSAHTVRADTQSVLNGTGKVTASRVTGTAALGWDAVRQALEIVGLPGIDPSAVQLSVNNNVVDLRFPLAAAGQQITLVASGTLAVDKGSIRLKLTDLRADGVTPSSIVQRTIDQYRSRMVINLNVPAMPYRLVITKVTTGEAGLTIDAAADDVVLAG